MNDDLYVENYIISCIHLYGIIHKKKLSELYKIHNDDQDMIFDQLDYDYLLEHFVYFEKEYFIHESIYIHNEMSKYIHEKNYKPFYIPEYDELLLYFDEFYTNESEYENQLYDLVLTYKNHIVAENVVQLCSSLAQLGISLEHVFRDISTYEFNEVQFEQMKPLIIGLYKNTRSWFNNGYTFKELVSINEHRHKISRNDLCPCGSQKKYKYCCIDKPLIGQGNPELYYEDVFALSKNDIEKFKYKLNREKIKVLFYIGLLSKPSIDDLIEELITKDLTDIINFKPNLIVAVLIQILFENHHMKFTDHRKNVIYKALRMSSKTEELPFVYENIMYELETNDMPTNDAVMKNILDFYKKHNYTPVKTINKNNPFSFLSKLQEKTVYQEDMDEALETLSYDVYLSNIQHKEIYLYNLLHIYPLSLATLRFIQDFVDIQNQEYIVKAIIYAFEAIYDNDMPKPSHDFCGHSLQKIYILSLDGLAYIYKQQKLFKKAIPLYKKMMHFDLEDRFRAKESILICYLYSKDIMTFEHAVDSLEDESLYKQAIILYNLIASEQPFVHQYLTLNEKYHFVLDAICYQYDLQDNNLSEMEKLFLDDFYQLFSQSKDVIEKLRKIHVDHSVDALL